MNSLEEQPRECSTYSYFGVVFLFCTMNSEAKPKMETDKERERPKKEREREKEQKTENRKLYGRFKIHWLWEIVCVAFDAPLIECGDGCSRDPPKKWKRKKKNKLLTEQMEQKISWCNCHQCAWLLFTQFAHWQPRQSGRRMRKKATTLRKETATRKDERVKSLKSCVRCFVILDVVWLLASVLVRYFCFCRADVVLWSAVGGWRSGQCITFIVNRPTVPELTTQVFTLFVSTNSSSGAHSFELGAVTLRFHVETEREREREQEKKKLFVFACDHFICSPELHR